MRGYIDEKAGYYCERSRQDFKPQYDTKYTWNNEDRKKFGYISIFGQPFKTLRKCRQLRCQLIEEREGIIIAGKIMRYDLPLPATRHDDKKAEHSSDLCAEAIELKGMADTNLNETVKMNIQ